ncbi:hypothetical protein ACTID9_10480 [Brevibacillus fluminis]|uniref:hypothetical protein n=1 Tax=Brevibacillus fluminis TaxID=511487 RepID=UPI003F8CE0FB
MRYRSRSRSYLCNLYQSKGRLQAAGAMRQLKKGGRPLLFGMAIHLTMECSWMQAGKRIDPHELPRA